MELFIQTWKLTNKQTNKQTQSSSYTDIWTSLMCNENLSFLGWFSLICFVFQVNQGTIYSCTHTTHRHIHIHTHTHTLSHTHTYTYIPIHTNTYVHNTETYKTYAFHSLHDLKCLLSPRRRTRRIWLVVCAILGLEAAWQALLKSIIFIISWGVGEVITYIPMMLQSGPDHRH